MFFGGPGGPGGGGGQAPFMFPGFGGPNGMPNGMPNGGGAGGFNPFEMMFGGGFGPGGPGNMEIDPTFMENFFGPGAAAGFAGGFQQAQAEEPRSSAPPTSKSTLRSLPRITVSARDIEKNESNECSICLDELVVGQPALRIPCGHLYHEDCVYDWLKKSNECPVCRFELPTDDAAYEQGRQERMADRKIRLRHEDLAGRSCGELKKLAIFLKIDTKGCLEKSEFVERIEASSQVQMVESHEGSEGPAASSSLFDYANGISSDTDPACSSAAAPDMPTANTGPAEAADVEMTDASSSASPTPQVDTSMPGYSAAASPEAVPSPPQAPNSSSPTSAEPSIPLAKQNIRQLRQLATQLDVSLSGCIEKEDIIQRIKAAPGYKGE